MLYLLDTTVFIDYARGMPSAVDVFRRLFEEGHTLYTCDAVVCEALSGGGPGQRGAILALLEPVEYVSTHPDAARWAAESRRNRSATSHRTLGDALIAGVAWFLHATIVTRNPDDFVAQGIPVLTYG